MGSSPGTIMNSSLNSSYIESGNETFTKISFISFNLKRRTKGDFKSEYMIIKYFTNVLFLKKLTDKNAVEFDNLTEKNSL